MLRECRATHHAVGRRTASEACVPCLNLCVSESRLIMPRCGARGELTPSVDSFLFNQGSANEMARFIERACRQFALSERSEHPVVRWPNGLDRTSCGRCAGDVWMLYCIGEHPNTHISLTRPACCRPSGESGGPPGVGCGSRHDSGCRRRCGSKGAECPPPDRAVGSHGSDVVHRLRLDSRAGDSLFHREPRCRHRV